MGGAKDKEKTGKVGQMTGDHGRKLRKAEYTIKHSVL